MSHKSSAGLMDSVIINDTASFSNVRQRYSFIYLHHHHTADQSPRITWRSRIILPSTSVVNPKRSVLGLHLYKPYSLYASYYMARALPWFPRRPASFLLIRWDLGIFETHGTDPLHYWAVYAVKGRAPSSTLGGGNTPLMTPSSNAAIA
jgi:hypothetical protein